MQAAGKPSIKCKWYLNFVIFLLAAENFCFLQRGNHSRWFNLQAHGPCSKGCAFPCRRGTAAGSGPPVCGPGNRLDNANFTAKTLFLYDNLKTGKKGQLKIIIIMIILITKKHWLFGTPGA